MAFLLKWATKLAIVGGATVLVINHEVFGANKYAQQVIEKVRTSLPDTAEAIDKMPTRHEINNAVVDTWNSAIQTSFKWLANAPSCTRHQLASLYDKIKS